MKKNGTAISIQQPEHLPWLSFFNKVANVDLVVLLDNVQFKKRYFENRTKIRNISGWQWLRTPVITKGKYHQKICDVEIDNSQDWRGECIKSVELNYRNSLYYEKYAPQLLELYKKEWRKLTDFNTHAIKLITNLLGLKKKFLISSKLCASGESTRLLVNICKKVGATTYLSGKFGEEYLDKDLFKKNGVELIFQDFIHPKYYQFHEGFTPNMSVIDLLFNEGEKSLEIIKQGFTLRK